MLWLIPLHKYICMYVCMYECVYYYYYLFIYSMPHYYSNITCLLARLIYYATYI
jgi:hypothetical protein